jgi:hypothetical protein
VVDAEGHIIGVLQGGYFPGRDPIRALLDRATISQIVSVEHIRKGMRAELKTLSARERQKLTDKSSRAP